MSPERENPGPLLARCSSALPYSLQRNSYVEMKLLVFEFLAITTCPITGHHYEESGIILLAATLEIFIFIN